MRRFFLAASAVLLIGLGSCKSSLPPYKGTDTPRLSPAEAFRLGKIKNTPYVINGKLYIPMSYEQATAYEETGIASWYGQETLLQHNGQATAYGEPFYPDKPSAAHKYLPLPSIVRVTNLDTSASIEVRVNDRGPFVDNRVIDLSAEAAKQLGFYEKGTARVKLEVISKP
ncbi:septal ring lytic transglycosylase RlpA family protein [Chlorobium phaeobacteroides]|jgi:rare lipoprotein A|uniref:Probable endolytic peptidoglycan transglycosylase RlpA n=1 Tax=Chlorobium phaeobacteroides (strain DSM 266 / SMG 266 / 2430) TaxID=290317 RepID=A1BJV4_CHLPD|nr:septal ring lytic transglycosylase RlpA family protein [Chlorobium phaeobacteroides]ABL66681.1 rare lipoprotein A [Chlorobium phaeobacteroides DSM 266]MBV5319914.1 septal ring lytic transglycosylase RlpA family protein [Chlorobium phaeobacteroides]